MPAITILSVMALSFPAAVFVSIMPKCSGKVFRLLGYQDDEVQEKFGGLLDAFEYGAPPHGGIAIGIDRFIMMLAGETTIRDVMAFPKNQNAVDMMLEAPSAVREKQLKELHIRLSDD